MANRSGKRIVEDCLTLDLARIMRLAPIREGQAGNGRVEWAVDGQAIGNARFSLDLRNPAAARLILRFTAKSADGETQEKEQIFSLASSAQPFGGRRWWLRCPVTGDRVRAVYLTAGGDRFAGRKAQGLAYRMEGLDRLGRAFEQLDRARRHFNGENGAALTTGKKPRGMWRRTFLRRVERIAALDADCTRRVGALISGDQTGTL